MNHRIASICAVGLALAGWSAGVLALDVKPGLWETTTSREGGGGGMPIPADVLAKMSPEQRAKMEARMKERAAAGPKVNATKSCITAERLKRGFDVDRSPDPSCKRTVINQTANRLEAHTECSGEHTRSSDFRFEALNRETIKGQIKIVSMRGGEASTINIEMTSKWLGGDCGTLKDKDD